MNLLVCFTDTDTTKVNINSVNWTIVHDRIFISSRYFIINSVSGWCLRTWHLYWEGTWIIIWGLAVSTNADMFFKVLPGWFQRMNQSKYVWCVCLFTYRWKAFFFMVEEPCKSGNFCPPPWQEAPEPIRPFICYPF